MQHLGKMLWIGALSLMLMGEALAEGKLSHLSGPVSVQKADGSKSAAVPGVVVGSGDTILTGANGFARLETPDGGEVVLRPNSEFVVEKLHFDQAKPEEDSFVYNMVKGGLRTVTGLIGKRGNKDAYVGKTPTSTIGIRGTIFEVLVCAGNCGPGVPNGTYLTVKSGSVQTGNSLGNVTLQPGQVVFVPPQGTPVVNPSVKPATSFTPPAAVPQKQQENPPPKPENGGTPPVSPPANNGGNNDSGGGVTCNIE